MRSLRGTHPGVVDRARVGRRLHSETQLGHLILVLKPSEEQNAALSTLLDAQQDRGSDSFHKWLTPDAFASSFGIAPSDIAQVSAWLSDSGLAIESVSRSGRFITFSGTVGSVETAFSTEMHELTLDGEDHISNTTDLSVPAALAPVVAGVARLNNFFPKSGSAHARTVSANAGGAVIDPEITGGSGSHYVGPADLATIYNATPLTQSGIDGTGISIAVLARSNISLSDVTTFRSMFGLKTNPPNVIVVGEDPGKNSDEIEAALDAEMAGSLATGATVNFIVSSPSLIGEGIDTAGLYAVDNNIGDIITLSYGGCEAANGASATAFWNALWEEAAAQGQTVFVSTGDSGAAGCASSSAHSAASSTVGVNALGSSAYNVAVGGSMFVDYGPSQYWSGLSTTSPYRSALSYVPEAAWNEGRLSTTDLNALATGTVTGAGVLGGGGGVSIFTGRPAWQTGSGISATADPSPIAAGSPITGLHRLVPDVAFIASNSHDATVFCYEGDCSQNGSGGLSSFGAVGGTSVAAPAMASAQALIDAANGGRQGNANYFYYALANNQYTAGTQCGAVTGTAGSPTVTPPASTCIFHDIVTGSNIVPTATSGTDGFGFTAVAGFDEATGLGSPNIANLAANWASVTFRATTTSFSLTPTTSAHGATQTVSIQVTSNTGTPTGDVSILATPLTATGSPLVFTLSNGAVSGNLASPLPAGTYNVHAHYAGDGVYAPSDSAPVTVTISKENSRIAVFQADTVSSGGSVAQKVSSIVFGSGEIYLDTEIQAASGNGTPSGNVTYTVLRNGSAMSPLTTALDTYGTTYLLSGPPYSAFFLLPNYATLPGGSYSVTASYAGDTSFNPSSATVNFTVAPTTPSISFTTTTPNISSGDSATFKISIGTPTAAQGATGTVTFTDSTTSAALGSATVTNGSATFSTTTLTTGGTHTITAAYSGDASYKSATPSPVTINVQQSTATTTTLTSTAGTVGGAAVTLTATVNPAPSAASTVSFYDSGALIGTSAVSPTTGIATLTVANFSGGTHSLTAVFAGDSAHTGSTGALSLTINRNVTTASLVSPASAGYGSSVTVVSKLTYGNAGATAPAVGLTGVVSFYDNSVTPAVLLGSAIPVFSTDGTTGSYVATFSLPTLNAGSHSISATYIGDASYAGSASTRLALTITKANQTVTFAAFSPAVYGSAGPYTLDATASSGLPVTYAVSGAATLSGNVLTVTGAGTTYVRASQAGDANYNAAVAVTQTLTVTRATQTISFPTLPATAIYGTDGPYTVAATASSGLPVTYSVSGPATLSGATLTITGAGTIYVRAMQAGDANHAPATTVQQTIVVAKAAQSINFTTLPATATYGTEGSFTVAASATSGLPVTYSVSGPAVLSGTTLTITGAGIISVRASQAGNTNFAPAATLTQTITVAKASQTISFTGLPASTQYLSGGPYTLAATASSGLAVTYAVSGPGKISGNTLTLTGAGTVVVTASQLGSVNYNAAAPVSQTIVVGKPAQTITFAALPTTATYGTAGPYTLSATASSGLAVTYTATGPARISGNTLTITGAGTVSVTASQTGSSNYSAATPVTQTITVAKADQTITFAALPATATYGTAGPYTLSSSASSALTVAYTVTGPARVSGSTLTITGAGTVSVTASQSGSTNYNAASPVTQTITVAKADQTIVFNALPTDGTYKAAGPYTLSSKATSGLTVTYSVSGPATLYGTTLTITGAGTVVVTANQAGSVNYNPAAPVTQTIVIAQASQTITFPALPTSASYGSWAFSYALRATSSSGLGITYSVSGPATVSGTAVTITGPGTVVVTASQAGTANYTPAAPISQTIQVSKLSVTVANTVTLQSDGSYLVTSTVTNTGMGTVENLILSAATLGKGTGTPLPQTLGNLAFGATVVASITVPASAGASGTSAALRISGSCTSGSFGSVSTITLP